MSKQLDLKFPNGRPVQKVRKDAKRLKKELSLTMTEALNRCARINGIDLPWDQAMNELHKRFIGLSFIEEELKLQEQFRPSDDFYRLLQLSRSQVSNRPKFIACVEWEGNINYYNLADTPQMAIEGFVHNGQFSDWCDSKGFEPGFKVEVKVFTLLYRDSPEAVEQEFEDDWTWMLGNEVSTTMIKVGSDHNQKTTRGLPKMNEQQLREELAKEQGTLNDLQHAFDIAHADLLSAMERDLNRRDGSMRQDALHERFMDESRQKESAAESALTRQQSKVLALKEKLSTLTNQ